MDAGRRWFVRQLALGIFAAPLAAEAQTATRLARVGYFGVESAPFPYLDAFREGLRRLGYVDGRSIAIESRLADGKSDRLSAFARELVNLKVDVLVGIT